MVPRRSRVLECHKERVAHVEVAVRTHVERAAPGRFAGRKRDVAAEALGTVDRVVEEKFAQRLVGEFALRLEPAEFEREHVFNREIFRTVEEQPEVEQAPLRPGLPVRRVEHGLGEDEIVRIRFLPTAAVASRTEKLHARETFVAQGVAEVELTGKIELPVPESSRPALAGDHAEIGALVVAVEGKSAIREPPGRAAQAVAVALATEHVRTVPPVLHDTAHAHAQREPLAARGAGGAGEDVARGDVLRIADENGVGLRLRRGGGRRDRPRRGVRARDRQRQDEGQALRFQDAHGMEDPPKPSSARALSALAKRSAPRKMQTGSVRTQAMRMLRTVAICSPELLAAMVPATPDERT